jgi:hypothetical protein
LTKDNKPPRACIIFASITFTKNNVRGILALEGAENKGGLLGAFDRHLELELRDGEGSEPGSPDEEKDHAAKVGSFI